MAVEPAQPVEPAVVEVDTPCRACAYSLRGLPSDGRCPECGVPVGESINDGILARCAARDVARTAGAMRFVLWATLGYVAVVATANFTVARIPARSVEEMIRRAQVRMAVELAASVVLAAAHWHLGRPLACAGDGTPGETARRVYRFSVAGYVASQFTVVALNLLARSVPGLMPLYRWAGTVAFVVSAVACVSFLAYSRALARRIPSDRLSRAAGRLMWGCGVSMAIYVTLGVIWGLAGRLSPVVLVMLGAAALAATAFLLTAAGAMMLLHRLRVAFTRAVRASTAPASASAGPESGETRSVRSAIP